MKHSHPSALFRTAVLLAALIIGATVLPAPAATPMEKAFERLEKSYKKLSEGLKSPSESSKPAFVEIARQIRKDAGVAAGYEPKMIATLPSNERAEFLAEFRKDMDQFTADCDKLVAAVESGDWAGTSKILDSLRQQKKAGHKTFRVQD